MRRGVALPGRGARCGRERRRACGLGGGGSRTSPATSGSPSCSTVWRAVSGRSFRGWAGC